MADQTDRHIPEHAESADDGGIVAELPVAVDFDEVRTKMFHVIQEVRTLRMPCELYLLVRREVIHVYQSGCERRATNARHYAAQFETNRVASADPFDGLHKFAIRRDLHVRIRPDQTP